MRNPFAKLRCVRTTGLWTLYWMRADPKWHAYRPASPAPDLESEQAGAVDVKIPSGARGRGRRRPGSPPFAGPGEEKADGTGDKRRVKRFPGDQDAEVERADQCLDDEIGRRVVGELPTIDASAHGLRHEETCICS